MSKFAASAIVFALITQTVTPASAGSFICSYVNQNEVYRKQIGNELLSEIETSLNELGEVQIFEYVSKNREKIYELAIQECGPSARCAPEDFRKVMLKIVARNADSMKSQGEFLLEHGLETASNSGIKLKELIPFSSNVQTTVFMLSISFKMLSHGLSVSIGDIGKSLVGSTVLASLYGTGKVVTKLIGKASYLIGRQRSLTRLVDESGKIDLSALRTNVEFSSLLSDLQNNLSATADLQQANTAMKEYGAAKVLVEEYYRQFSRSDLAAALGSTSETTIAWNADEIKSIKKILEKNLPTLEDRARFLIVTRLIGDELNIANDEVRDQYIRKLLGLP